MTSYDYEATTLLHSHLAVMSWSFRRFESDCSQGRTNASLDQPLCVFLQI